MSPCSQWTSLSRVDVTIAMVNITLSRVDVTMSKVVVTIPRVDIAVSGGGCPSV